MTNPTVSNVKRHAGIAGQYAVSALVQYPGESAETLTFVGSTYGGPIIMCTASGAQHYVSRVVLDRIGATLSPAWVRAFFAPHDAEERT